MSKTGLPAVGGGVSAGGVDLGIPPRTLLPANGKYTRVPYGLSNLNQNSSAITDSQLWLLPFPVFAACTLAELHARIDSGAGSAGSVARLGLYPFTVGASPLFDSGAIATQTAFTTITAVCNQPLSVGWYIAAFVQQGNPVTKPINRLGAAPSGAAIMSYDSSEAYFNNDAGTWGYTMSGVSGALPALSALSVVNAASPVAPIIGLKFV